MDLNDERFSIQIREEGVFLTVAPPAEDSQVVQVGQILDALANQQIVEYNRQALEEATGLKAWCLLDDQRLFKPFQSAGHGST